MDRYDPLDTSIGFEDRAGDWSGDRIVAAFENADRARAAREGLIEAGIDNANIELLENRSDLDTWTAIKRHAVPDEDAHLYAEGLGRGNSIMIIQAAAGEHDRVVQVLSRFNPIDIDDHAAQWRKSGWSGVHPGKAAWDVQRQTATPSGTTAAPGTQEQVIPVYEEQLKVGKRVVEHGRVRVRVYTIEHPVQEGVTLREERVAVERRPVDRPASGLPGEAFRDRTIDLTTHREEPVIAKEARVKEEVVVRNEADQRTETLRDSVRRTEVEVEDDRATATTPPPRSNAPSQR
jgi:stress response protein YsnF